MTRCKSETLSGRYRSNGYVLSPPHWPQDALAGKPGSYSKSETLSTRYRSNGYVLSPPPLAARTPSPASLAPTVKAKPLSGRYRSNG